MMAGLAIVGRMQPAKAWSLLSLISSHLAALHLVRALPAAKGQDSFCEVVGVDSSFACRGSASLLQQERFRLEAPNSLAEMASMQPKAPKTSLAATASRQPKAPLSSLANMTDAADTPPWQWSKSPEAEWKKLPVSLKIKEALSRNAPQSWGRLANKSSASNASNASNVTSGKNVSGNNVSENVTRNPLVAKDMEDPRCTPGHQCGNGSMPLERSICIPCLNGTKPNQCWDVCNAAHRPEDYDIGDGDKTFARQLAQAVRDVRDGKVDQLKCPALVEGEGSSTKGSNASSNLTTNKSMNGTSREHLKEQLMKKATEVFQASQLADQASAKAASLMKAAQDEFFKALNSSNLSALSHAIELWEETASAHAEAYLKAGNVSETLKELRAMLDFFTKEGSEKVAKKVLVAKEKEAIAKNLTRVADQKRNEAVKAAAKAANATHDAVKAREEANASSNNLTKTADQALKAALNGTTTTVAHQSATTKGVANQSVVTTAPPANQSASTQAPLANQSVNTTLPPAATS